MEVGRERERRYRSGWIDAGTIGHNHGTVQIHAAPMGGAEHPVERNAAEAGVAVASADIGMDAPEPSFVEAGVGIQTVKRKVVARFIQRHGVAAALNPSRHFEFPSPVDLVAGNAEGRHRIKEAQETDGRAIGK